MAAPPRRVALVTGGGRGIGREIALALARAGLDVAVAARTRAQVEAVAAAARGLGGRALALELDVGDGESIARAVAATEAALGPVDVLVNNAGIAESAPLLATAPEVWDRHVRINATGPFLVTRAVLGAMLARRWGRVINIASLVGLHGAPYVTAYAASKHALVGLTRALALEVAGRGVTVNAICPGYVATDLVWSAARHIEAKTGRSFDEAVASMARINPGGRLIEPAEVAAVALALVRDEARNAEAIVLDGGAPAQEASMARELQFHNPPGLMKAVGYTHGVETRGGRLLFFAGQVAKDKDGRTVGKGDVVAQFRQVCENLRTVVAAAGGQLGDVVKLTIYVLDADEYKRQGKAIGAVYREYFGRHFPAMTLVGARDLYDAADGCLLEIDGFACLP